MTIAQIFNSQAKTITFAAGLLVLSSFLSRALGLARNSLLSWRFGAGTETDIYFAAFRIPDFLYGILIMGGISAVFLPLFSEYFAKNKEEAWEFTSNLLNMLLIGLVFLAGAAFFTAPLLVDLVAPGFSEEQQEITASLTRLMLLSPLLLGISAVFSGTLQYFHKFVAYSLAPLMYNIGIIGGIIFLTPLFGLWGLAWGVVAGAILHLAVQIPAAAKSGFSWRPIFRPFHPSNRKLSRLALPRTIAAASYHINLIVIGALASLISTGSVTIFNYANDMQYFPVGLVGVSFALAAFPSLARFFAEHNPERFHQIFVTTFRQIIFFAVPSALLLFLLRAQIVRLVYGAGDLFTWEDTRLTAAVLGIFAFGIVFQALIPFLARTFFSVQDTRTPTVIGLVAVVLNIVLAFWFLDMFTEGNIRDLFVATLKLQGIENVRILALPLALVISGTVQLLMLFYYLHRKVQGVYQREIVSFLGKVGAASAALVIATYVILQVYGTLIPLTTYIEVLLQMGLASAGGLAAYGITAYFLKCSEVNSLWIAARRQFYGK